MKPPRGPRRLLCHVGVRHRVRVHAPGDQAGVVRHVHHEDGAHVLGHPGKACPVDDQRIGRGTGNDDARLVLVRQTLHLVVIDLFLLVQAVGHHIEPAARHVDRRAVREVTAHGQRHAQDGVTRLGQPQEHGLVGLRARIGLHVGGLGPEELLHAVQRQLLGHVHALAATVVALAGIALGILVGELAALGFHHRRAGVVLRRDQLDVSLLAAVLVADGIPEGGIDLGKRLFAIKHVMHSEAAGQPDSYEKNPAQADGRRRRNPTASR